MKLKVLIADDERIARQRLRRLLEQEEETEIVAECADGSEALETIGKVQPNLLFVDIQMPKIDGFELVEAIDCEHEPAVVFVTAFDKHAVHAFDTCAVDYLLKPVSQERLSKALNRAREHLQARGTVSSSSTPPSASPRFSVRSGQTTTFVAPEEIDWVEADGNYAILHVGARNHLLRRTMASLEADLPAGTFLRISRSAIVRVDQVKEIRAVPGGHHVAVLNDSQEVPITRPVREIQNRLRK